MTHLQISGPTQWPLRHLEHTAWNKNKWKQEQVYEHYILLELIF